VSDLPPLDELFPQPKRGPDGFLDLRGLDLRGRNFEGRSRTRIRFGAKEEKEEPALLEGVSFRSSSLENVHFCRAKRERGLRARLRLQPEHRRRADEASRSRRSEAPAGRT
jgi:uncharacterized protein YjbI with pentapeptide repeats